MLLALTLICITISRADLLSGFAEQKPAPYSLGVKWATKDSQTVPERAVYIWPWVKTPGAYAFREGMTVAELVALAGGLILDERYKDVPELKDEAYPKTIDVTRPSPENPDPTTSMYQCALDWSKSDAGISQCRFELHQGDLVGISMSAAVP